MAIDSTADLLFRINANSDDAEGNIKRFRSVLSKDLGGIGSEFSDWATKTFGALNTLGGVSMAAGAAVAAGLVAVGAAVSHATNKYVEYVSEVARGSNVTGIGVRDMSVLRVAADKVGASYEGLTKGLSLMAAAVVKANAGGEEQVRMFARLGVTREQLASGEKNLYPLVEQVAEGFHNLESRTQGAGFARDMFSRSFGDTLKVLRMGKEGLKEMADEAHRLGLELTAADVEAVKRLKAAQNELNDRKEAVEVATGRAAIGLKTQWEAFKAAFAATVTNTGEVQGGGFLVNFAGNLASIQEEIDRTAKAMSKLGNQSLQTPPGTAKVLADFEGLSNLLDQVKGKLAALDSDEAKAGQDIEHLLREIDKATEDLKAKNAKGDLAPGVFDRELAAFEELAQRLPVLHQQMLDEIAKKRKQAGDEASAELRQRLQGEVEQTLDVRLAGWNAEMDALWDKLQREQHLTLENAEMVDAIRAAGAARMRSQQAEADRQATSELEKRVHDEAQKTLASQHDAWDEEINQLWLQYAAKKQLTEQNEAMIAAIRKAGHEKLDADAKAAFDSEIAALREHLVQIRSEHMTTAERTEAQYGADVAKFSAAEERKALTLATSEQQRTQITAMYAAIRAALLGKEGADLNALRNSQGWQGVFGSQFAQMLRGNEALTKQWASSSNQSHMLVRASLEGLREAGRRSFEQLAQGMGQNIASALVYKKSIGEAMRSAAAATLESLAAESITYAIYSSALGFLRLAQHDYVGAGQAFTSAAIWGSVGVAAAVAGRMIAPSQAGAGGAGTAAAGGTGGAAGEGSGTGSDAQQQRGPRVQVIIQGHVFGISGVQEIASAINDAVLNRDVQLTATNTKTGKQVVK